MMGSNPYHYLSHRSLLLPINLRLPLAVCEPSRIVWRSDVVSRLVPKIWDHVSVKEKCSAIPLAYHQSQIILGKMVMWLVSGVTPRVRSIAYDTAFV